MASADVAAKGCVPSVFRLQVKSNTRLSGARDLGRFRIVRGQSIASTLPDCLTLERVRVRTFNAPGSSRHEMQFVAHDKDTSERCRRCARAMVERREYLVYYGAGSVQVILTGAGAHGEGSLSGLFTAVQDQHQLRATRAPALESSASLAARPIRQLFALNHSFAQAQLAAGNRPTGQDLHLFLRQLVAGLAPLMSTEPPAVFNALSVRFARIGWDAQTNTERGREPLQVEAVVAFLASALDEPHDESQLPESQQVQLEATLATAETSAPHSATFRLPWKRVWRDSRSGRGESLRAAKVPRALDQGKGVAANFGRGTRDWRTADHASGGSATTLARRTTASSTALVSTCEADERSLAQTPATEMTEPSLSHRAASTQVRKPLPSEASGGRMLRKPRQNVLPAGRDPLDEIRPSGRYTMQPWTRGQVDALSLKKRGFVESRTNGKVIALIAQMRLARPPPADDTLSTVTWMQSQNDIALAGGVPTLKLEGPASSLAQFLHVVHICTEVLQDVDAAVQLGQKQLWPCFVLSRGRPYGAHLNWTAEHVLGAAATHLEPPVVAVVSPEERDEYRRCWPGALLLSLPEGGRALGYARHVLKRALEWRTPYFWMVDDNIAAFVRLEADAHGSLQRHWHGPVFREAFMHLQRHPSISDTGLAGFLRATGTEVNKRATEVFNATAIYKVALINTVVCAGVDYIAALAKFEDIAFIRELQLRNIPTLKVQTFAYWSFHTKTGGCAEQRTSMQEDTELVHPSYRVTDLSEAERAVVAKLQEWVRANNNKPMPSQLEASRAGCSGQRMVLKASRSTAGASHWHTADSVESDDGQNASDEVLSAVSETEGESEMDNVVCMHCGEDDAEGNQILLCDGSRCNGAFHQLCLPQPLERIPRGQWFCPLCSEACEKQNSWRSRIEQNKGKWRSR